MALLTKKKCYYSNISKAIYFDFYSSQQVINHNDPVVDNVEVLQVVTDDNIHAWTFLYPGYYVYQWEDKQIKNRLDCSKLVPCSESMKSIAIDEHFSPGIY